jgi:hypothetical protein
MGAVSFRYFDDLRRQHFPADRNHLSAHLTLFHHLPPSVLPELSDMMRSLAAQYPPLQARVAGVMSLGRGTAFRIESEELMAVREEIADRFFSLLTPQDRGRPRLHVTVQNKVVLKDAIALQQELTAGFRPHDMAIKGLAAHYYRGGPWEPVFDVSFRGRG